MRPPLGQADRFNRVVFDTVTTTAVRIEAEPRTVHSRSGEIGPPGANFLSTDIDWRELGIIEWRVSRGRTRCLPSGWTIHRGSTARLRGFDGFPGARCPATLGYRRGWAALGFGCAGELRSLAFVLTVEDALLRSRRERPGAT